MELLELVSLGAAAAITPQNIIAVFMGCLIGTIVGAFPGLSAPTAIALLLPITFHFEPTTGLIMLAGIYYGSQFGNSITAILIGIPGDSAAVLTALEGHKLALAGRAGQALTLAASGSFVAGIIGVTIFSVVGPPLAWFGLRFGDPEYVALILLAFCTLPAFSDSGYARMAVAVLMGLLLTTVGLDFATGQPRFTFGQTSLMDGIPLVPAIIGLFGIADAFYTAGLRTANTKVNVSMRLRDLAPPVADWIRVRWTLLRASLLGFIVGVLPGAGATIAAFAAYAMERSLARDKSRYGHGDITGLVAAEAGNSGASIGAMLPMLALGIPGSGATAVMLGGFLMWGLQPGPALFEKQPVLVWGLVVSMLIGNMMLLAMNVLLVPWFARILRLPHTALVPVIVVFCAAGAYATNNSVVDVVIMFAFGLLGLLLRILNIPAAAMVLALVLGGSLEEHVRRTMLVSDEGLWALFTRPISGAVLTIAAVLLLAPAGARFLRSLSRRRVDKQTGAPL